MSRNLLSASLVAVGLALWMGSGAFFGGEEEPTVDGVTEAQALAAPETTEAGVDRVRVAVIDSQLRTRNVVLRGRTQSKRMVDVKAEIAGNIIARPVQRGMQVAEGDLLCEVAVDDRGVALREARAAYETARIEHQGSLKLRTQGLLSEVAVANSQARQEAALAQLRRQELNLERTRILAPFAGVVEDLHMNVGDYATAGATCATLLDLDPMLVAAQVTEGEVDSLAPGQRVFGTTSTGRAIAGTVSFVGKQSNPVTRTYPVEITVDNSDYSIRSGLTVSLRVGVERVPAHQVSPSLLTLNDAGQIGLRTLDGANRVVFNPVTILEDGADGLWITGLPTPASLITVGQEYVALGEVVEPVYVAQPASGAAAQDQLAGL